MRRIEFCYRAFFLVASAIALFATVGCTGTESLGAAASQGQAMKVELDAMFDDIYTSAKPEGFEEIDVSSKVLDLFPLGSGRASIENAFKGSRMAKVVEVTPQTVVVRSDKGKAMFDVDPRSIVISFEFDAAGKLSAVEAIHFKNQ